jgi:hypothetical protein
MRWHLSFLLLGSALVFACAAPSPGPAPDGSSRPTGDDDDDDSDDDDDVIGGEAQDIVSAPAPAPAPPPAVNPPANTCETARDIGTVNGDEGGESVEAEGKCAEWVRVRVHEADDGWRGNEMKIKVTLTSPAGHDFDLAAFINTTADVPECRRPHQQTQSRTGTDEIKLEWGEDFLANNADDSRTLAIQVTSGNGVACAATPWKLVIGR